MRIYNFKLYQKALSLLSCLPIKQHTSLICFNPTGREDLNSYFKLFHVKQHKVTLQLETFITKPNQ